MSALRDFELLDPVDSVLEAEVLAMRAANTSAARGTDWRQFKDFCRKSWADVTEADVAAYCEKIAWLKPATRRRKLDSLSLVLRHAEKRVFGDKPCRAPGLADYVGRLRSTIKEVRESVACAWPSPADLQEILAVAMKLDAHKGRLLAFLYLTAARVSEALQFDLSQVTEDRGRPGYWCIRKGGHEGFIPVAPEMIEDLQRHYDGTTGPLWAMERDAVNAFVERVMKRVNKKRRIGLRLRVSPHTFRHMFCSHSLNNYGLTVAQVKDQTGHSSVQHLTRYLHADKSAGSALAQDIVPRLTD